MCFNHNGSNRISYLSKRPYVFDHARNVPKLWALLGFEIKPRCHHLQGSDLTIALPAPPGPKKGYLKPWESTPFLCTWSCHMGVHLMDLNGAISLSLSGHPVPLATLRPWTHPLIKLKIRLIQTLVSFVYSASCAMVHQELPQMSESRIESQLPPMSFNMFHPLCRVTSWLFAAVAPPMAAKLSIKMLSICRCRVFSPRLDLHRTAVSWRQQTWHSAELPPYIWLCQTPHGD